MRRLKAKTLAYLSILSLIAPVALRAADSTMEPAPGTASTPPHRKHHRKPKKPVSDSSAESTPSGAAVITSSPSVVPGAAVMPNTSDINRPGSAGGPNMGAGDHVPGTTGTSGQ